MGAWIRGLATVASVLSAALSATTQASGGTSTSTLASEGRAVIRNIFIKSPAGFKSEVRESCDESISDL